MNEPTNGTEERLDAVIDRLDALLGELRQARSSPMEQTSSEVVELREPAMIQIKVPVLNYAVEGFGP